MMSDMISYTSQLLGCIADFLASEPIIYLFGIVCACFIVKMLISLMSWR